MSELAGSRIIWEPSRSEKHISTEAHYRNCFVVFLWILLSGWLINFLINLLFKDESVINLAHLCCCCPASPECWSILLRSAMKKTWITTCTSISRYNDTEVCECMRSGRSADTFVGCCFHETLEPLLNGWRKKMDLCGCVCLGQQECGYRPCAQNTAQTHTWRNRERKKKTEERVID